jgi:hypothetical protein
MEGKLLGILQGNKGKGGNNREGAEERVGNDCTSDRKETAASE